MPNTARLGFRLSLFLFNWLVIWAALLLVRGFFFASVLVTLGFLIVRPWLRGYDKSAIQHLLFLDFTRLDRHLLGVEIELQSCAAVGCDPLQSLVIHPDVRAAHAGAFMYLRTVSTPVASPESALPSASLHFNQRHRYE